MFLNILIISIIFGIIVLLSFYNSKQNRQVNENKNYINNNFIPDKVFINDGSLIFQNQRLEKIMYSSRFTASLKNNSPHSLRNIIVEIRVLSPTSSSCEDKIIDTLNFEALKYEDNKILNTNSVRMIQYDFSFSESNYPEGWKYCATVLGGIIQN